MQVAMVQEGASVDRSVHEDDALSATARYAYALLASGVDRSLLAEVAQCDEREMRDAVAELCLASLVRVAYERDGRKRYVIAPAVVCAP